MLGRVKLGLMSAALAALDLDTLAGWAADEGFEALEIACWPQVTGDLRRYAGRRHVDDRDARPGWGVGFALRCHVDAGRVNLDFSQCQRPLPAGQLDPHILAAGPARLAGPTSRQLLRQAGQERRHPGAWWTA